MKSKFIKLKNTEDILCFTKNAELVNGDVTIRKGKYVIDGKSYLGLVVLDPFSGVTVEYPEEEETFDKYLTRFTNKGKKQ